MSPVIRSVTLFSIGLALAAAAGCQRSEPVEWQSSAQVKKLAAALGGEVQKVVQEHAGTVLKPRLVSEGEPDFKRELELKLGQEVYMKRCVQCHGVHGDGSGPVASSLYPRPRDYTRGIFKFTSTPYGGKPRREDLMATLDRGIVGTSMPNFRLLPKKEIEAVVDYVLVLAQRGELEYQLANDAYLRAIRLAPSSAMAHFNAGVTYRHLGEPTKALESLRRAASLASSDADDTFSMRQERNV